MGISRGLSHMDCDCHEHRFPSLPSFREGRRAQRDGLGGSYLRTSPLIFASSALVSCRASSPPGRPPEIGCFRFRPLKYCRSRASPTSVAATLPSRGAMIARVPSKTSQSAVAGRLKKATPREAVPRPAHRRAGRSAARQADRRSDARGCQPAPSGKIPRPPTRSARTETMAYRR
jgi:hypothetical protein